MNFFIFKICSGVKNIEMGEKKLLIKLDLYTLIKNHSKECFVCVIKMNYQKTLIEIYDCKPNGMIEKRREV